MVDNEKLKRAAYAMVKAYRDNLTCVDAVHSISNDDDFIDLPDGVLRGMWMAIDAYIDLNT